MASSPSPTSAERGAARPFRRALVIANPIAGRGRGERAAEELVAHLGELGLDVALHRTRHRGDARETVAQRRGSFDLAASVGGDGTLREVFEGLGDDSVPVAVLPLGTANVLAIDLALPRSPAGLAELVRRGHSTALDVAAVNGRLSFLVTGVGFDAAVVAEVERRRRGSITKWSYVPAALAALRQWRPTALHVELDGAAVEGPVEGLFASNIVHYGGVLRLSPTRVLDDGLFDIYLFRDARLRGLGAAGLRGLCGRLPGGSCELRRARSVRVTSERPVPYHVDGDFGGTTPIELTVGSTRRRILVP
jgi:YegS/Rv2252/BmrU family lipid kinase